MEGESRRLWVSCFFIDSRHFLLLFIFFFNWWKSHMMLVVSTWSVNQILKHGELHTLLILDCNCVLTVLNLLYPNFCWLALMSSCYFVLIFEKHKMAADKGNLFNFNLMTVTWNITCTYSQFLAQKTPTCCVSLSSFYNDRIVPCPTCTCGCQNNKTQPGSCVEYVLFWPFSPSQSSDVFLLFFFLASLTWFPLPSPFLQPKIAIFSFSCFRVY